MRGERCERREVREERGETEKARGERRTHHDGNSVTTTGHDRGVLGIVQGVDNRLAQVLVVVAVVVAESRRAGGKFDHNRVPVVWIIDASVAWGLVPCPTRAGKSVATGACEQSLVSLVSLAIRFISRFARNLQPQYIWSFSVKSLGHAPTAQGMVPLSHDSFWSQSELVAMIMSCDKEASGMSLVVRSNTISLALSLSRSLALSLSRSLALSLSLSRSLALARSRSLLLEYSFPLPLLLNAPRAYQTNRQTCRQSTQVGGLRLCSQADLRSQTCPCSPARHQARRQSC